MRRGRGVGRVLLACAVLASASAAAAQRGSERQPRGHVVTGAAGPSFIGRVGYGGAIDRPHVNPVNLALGLELAYAARYVPVAIGFELDGTVGAREEFQGLSRYDNLVQAMAWFGYDRAINRRFVVRPAMAVGVELWRIDLGPYRELATGALVAFQGRGLIFLRERLYFDSLLRVTGSVHRTVNAGPLTSRSGIPCLMLYAGIGYSFGAGRTRSY